jgi:hypothetical protein
MSARPLTAVALAAALATAGCRGVPVHIDNAVPPDIDRSAGRTIEGDAYGFQFVLLIPAGVNTRHERAWQEILDQAHGDYVTNVQLKEGWYYGIIGTLYHTTFRATAYPRRSTATAAK